jgi:polyhydroxyalkanoate synthesis regulator phasin
MKMKYCNDTHKQAVVSYAGQECPLCLMQHRLIEMADAQEDIDKQNIQELWTEVELLTRRVKALEANRAPVAADNPQSIWNYQLND